MIRRLVEDFRAGRSVSTVQDPYKAFALHKGERPTLLRYELPLDDAWMRRVVAESDQGAAGRRPDATWLRSVEPQAADDTWVTREDLRPLDDVCTKFVTRKFLPDAFARVNLVANVIRLYDRLARVTHLPFRIVFKGGVMQRLVLLEFWHDMPLDARVAAVSYLVREKAVSISDMDFQIVPTRHDMSEPARRRLLVVCYAALLWLQRKLTAEVDEGAEGMLDVSWDRAHGTEELKAMLQEAVGELERDHPMHGARIEKVVIGNRVGAPPAGFRTRGGKTAPAPRRDLFVFDCGEERVATCVAPASEAFRAMGMASVPASAGDSLYATCNYYLNEGAEVQRPGAELRPLFHLARIKHTFVLYYTTARGERRCDRLAGELVDLSLADPRDEGELDLHARLGRAFSDAYREYPIVGVSGVALRSYTVAHFLLDHEHMLHRSPEPPWRVPKFRKRLVRYVAFLVAHVLGSEVGGTLERKVHALQALVWHTASVQRLLGPRLRTGVAPVDAFAERERLSYRRGAGEYLRTLHAHLKALVGFVSQRAAWRADLVVPSHLWHTDHIETK